MIFLALLAGLLAPVEVATGERWCLPSTVGEASGLAVSGASRVLTHNDEHGIIHEIDVDEEKLLRAFALGKPTAADDFEGITVTGPSTIWMVNSLGRLYETQFAEHGQRVTYNTYDSGLSGRCEVEGLTHDPQSGDLFLICKQLRDAPPDRLIEIYRWSSSERKPVGDPVVAINAATAGWEDVEEVFPSALEWDDENKAFLILSARTREIFRISASGALLDHYALSARQHDKTEGLALLPDGRIFVVDEKDSACGRISILDGID